jgi:hypothetical protein
MAWGRFTVTLALLFAALIHIREIRVGTVIPIMLSSSLNAAKDAPGKKIEGRIMQQVPLPAGGAISERSRILGHVVNVIKPGPSGSSIVVAFDTIEDRGRTIPITTGLLAMASMSSVFDAGSPVSANSDMVPVTQWVTRQVGGDLVRRGWGKVATASGISGTWLQGSSVLIRLTPNPAAGCPDGPGYDREQAVWVFSSAACGAYGLGDLKITSTGSHGQITLTSRRNVSVRGGSGWLLIAVAESGDAVDSAASPER